VGDDLELTPFSGGTRLRLRVKAGANKTAIVGVHDGALKLKVAAAPERGKANRAVVKLLADTLGLAASAVTIAAGKASQDKVAEIALDVAAVCARLADRELPKKREAGNQEFSAGR
jgi:uncharacterized protein